MKETDVRSTDIKDAAVDNSLMESVKQKVAEAIDISREYSDEEFLALIEDKVFEATRYAYLNSETKRKLIESIFNSRRRYDVLQPLLEDSSITEIMVNGPGCVFIERGGKIEKTGIAFESEEKLYNIINSIVSRVNRAVNESSPIVDARLSDGSRVNAVLKPIALNGPVLTIRKFSGKPLTMDQLVALGSLTAEVAEFFGKMVRAKYNIFISGGTGSGKTTFLNALSGFIPRDERIITIEDSAELQLTWIDNIVRLETRNPNTEGKGQITIRDLIRTSLRMRPNRIIIGEVRGAEALDMLQAMNTGHDGSLSTGHANSTADMLSRLETMVLCAAQIPLEAIRQQIASALDLIVHLGRLRDSSRRVLEITEVLGCENGQIKLNPLYRFEERGVDKNGVIVGELVKTGTLKNMVKLMQAGISL